MFAALGLAVTLIVATAHFRQMSEVGLQSDNFWALKLGWHGCADCVLAGDSRVGAGLAPAAMVPLLPGRCILNFAFASARYTDDYLDAVERVLDHDAGQRVIVLGITPMSLLPAGPVGFERLRADIGRLSSIELLALRGLRFLGPMRVDTVADELNPWRKQEVVTTRCPDGWAGYAPPRDRTVALRLLEATFAARSVAPAAIERVVERVRRWTADGIVVYALRPPTCAEILEIEGRLSGFDEAQFIARFEAVGGTWIAVAPLGYDTPDGSHLQPESAALLSRDVARVVAARSLAESK